MMRWTTVSLVLAAACGTSVDVPSSATGPGTTAASSSISATSSSGVGGAGGMRSSGGGGAGGMRSSTAVTGGGGTCGGTVADYGDCDLALGWIYDGEHCVPMSGCGCEPDCDAFHDDALECVASCPGACDEAAFVGQGLVADGWGQGDYCDELYACIAPSAADLVETVVGGQLTCSEGGSCPAGEQRCTLTSGVVSPELMANLCSASLLPSLGSWRCLVLGP